MIRCYQCCVGLVKDLHTQPDTPDWGSRGTVIRGIWGFDLSGTRTQSNLGPVGKGRTLTYCTSEVVDIQVVDVLVSRSRRGSLELAEDVTQVVIRLRGAELDVGLVLLDPSLQRVTVETGQLISGLLLSLFLFLSLLLSLFLFRLRGRLRLGRRGRLVAYYTFENWNGWARLGVSITKPPPTE